VLILATAAAWGLAGCDNIKNALTQNDVSEGSSDGAGGATSVRLVDRDVEAPGVFQTTDDALWDGRPSLGGVWVASPDAVDPERVILRNTTNGKFVIAALFRREQQNPGPKLQISSDAAAALGVLAGQPVKINVTALRREEVAATAPDATKPILDAAETVQTQSLDAVQTASAALDKVAPSSTPAAPTIRSEVSPPAAKPVASSAKSGGPNSLIQIGIFSVEANAKRALDTLAKASVPATLKKDSSQGKDFWRVTAGPAVANERATMLAKVKGLGFADAYFVAR